MTVNSVNAFLANTPLGYTKHLGVEPEGNGLTDRHFPNGKFSRRQIPNNPRKDPSLEQNLSRLGFAAHAFLLEPNSLQLARH